MIMKLIEFYDTDAKLVNLKNLLLRNVHIASSVSAQKLKCPPRLGSAQNLHSLGSFELENSGLGSSLEVVDLMCSISPKDKS